MSTNMSKVKGMLFLHAFTKKLNNKKDLLERKPTNKLPNKGRCGDEGKHS